MGGGQHHGVHMGAVALLLVHRAVLDVGNKAQLLARQVVAEEVLVFCGSVVFYADAASRLLYDLDRHVCPFLFSLAVS